MVRRRSFFVCETRLGTGHIALSLAPAKAIVCGCVAIVLVAFCACRGHSATGNSVTVTLLDPGWLDRTFLEWREHEVDQFTSETGIHVRLLPAPETEVDQVTLWRRLLQDPEHAPDVFAIDVIWPNLIAEYALPLGQSTMGDTSSDFPYLVTNNTVNGALVAMPYHIDAGLLFYRTDLLREYGYRGPPTTWSELEVMASRIQKGERAKGNKDFWGFVWQGAASEALTCNALEWQVSEGGGRIIEADRTISVNNPKAVRAWTRAAHWVGTISPPSVTAYREWDALNVWRSGNAAFMRNWPTSYVTSKGENSSVAGRFGVSLLPAGTAGHTGTLGGASLSIYRKTKHPAESLALVRFLCRRDVQRARSLVTSQPATFPDLYGDEEVLKANPHFQDLKSLFLQSLAKRPWAESNEKYLEVSDAYFHAVHSVLTKKLQASQAARQLEDQLIRLTGLPKNRAPQLAIEP